MLPVERHQAIIAAVNATRVVTTEHLVQLLGVSPETVRRDLGVLEEQGSLRRVHGGAASIQAEGGEEPPYSERSSLAHENKERLAAAAVSLIETGQTIVIDIGTTAVEVARAIPHTFRGTVATPSLLVAAELADRPGIDILVSGGRVRSGDLACANAHAKAFFEDLYADLAFVGSGGVDEIIGLTDFHLDEVDVRKTIIRNSAHSYVLADASKLGRVAPYRVCDFTALDGLITDSAVPENLAAAIEDAGGIVLSA
ncbi:DeoR family fructose operon transcriptional repressor [Rhodococcus sp. 27YEA15]|uniref:DeoR/GlpR family DNA-binding transcription regulator n=1 Tax=Rhodococcus sp. 27YEA15 TaxID=3156259 RepID=UPI003C7BE5AB